VLGTENILEAALANNVERVVCLSTDKAVYPINAMGLTKALMEKVMAAKSRISDSSILCATRYGNVMASRGSVIPLFIEQIKNEKPITITDPNMTRFMMTLDDSVDLVFFAFTNSKPGDIFVQKSPATTISIMAQAVAEVMDAPDHPINIIGTRHGEKLYEVLLSREEMISAEDLGNYYRVAPDLRDLNYNKYFSEGEIKVSTAEDYNSHNADRLDLQGTKDLLLSIPYISDVIKGINTQPDF
jgi:UDP-glucose 4-epimerase